MCAAAQGGLAAPGDLVAALVVTPAGAPSVRDGTRHCAHMWAAVWGGWLPALLLLPLPVTWWARGSRRGRLPTRPVACTAAGTSPEGCSCRRVLIHAVWHWWLRVVGVPCAVVVCCSVARLSCTRLEVPFEAKPPRQPRRRGHLQAQCARQAGAQRQPPHRHQGGSQGPTNQGGLGANSLSCSAATAPGALATGVQYVGATGLPS